MKGIYALIVKLDGDRKIAVGKLGPIDFKKGYYAYIGSALNSFEGRINRHLRKDKKLRWHIDYLLEAGHIVEILIFETDEKLECAIAKKIQKNLEPIKNFGASDCKCESHLFYAKENPAALFEDFSSFSAPQ
jgi:sugar fermentation stimulation protein A